MGNSFHIGWSGNFKQWAYNPIASILVAHTIWDPHSYTASVIQSFSSLYNQLLSLGFLSATQVFTFTQACNIIALVSLTISLIQYSVAYNYSTFNNLFDTTSIRFNYHLATLFGVSSTAWCGHLVHITIPASHLQTFILTFTASGSQILSDISHHHLAIGCTFILSAHVYQSIYQSIGTSIRDLYSTFSTAVTLTTSLHFQLTLALFCLTLATQLCSSHIYSLAPYLYLSYDYVSSAALVTHHTFIASILGLGSAAHYSIFLVRDYTTTHQSLHNLLLAHKASVISHCSYSSLLLGFHILGLYIHNDIFVAFGQSQKQILIEPAVIQDTTLTQFLGPGDVLAAHSVALGLHVTALVSLKGSLDSRGSKLVPDKIMLGFGLACDGPNRGGTCDISAWDSFYLASFWVLNTDAWFLFLFHWKHLVLWQSSSSFESSTYLMGWFRDYLWFNSTPVIRGYNANGANDNSVWAILFLGAHLVWATGFMFLISWRGYWQELIDIILYQHLQTPFLSTLWAGGYYTPSALSIVQARCVGLAHFGSGFILTYAAFVIGATA